MVMYKSGIDDNNLCNNEMKSLPRIGEMTKKQGRMTFKGLFSKFKQEKTWHDV